jgi:hypothetical protein
MAIVHEFGFQVRDDGVYHAVGDGPYRRIATPSELAIISCQHGELSICVGKPNGVRSRSYPAPSHMLWRGMDLPDDIVATIRSRLLNRAVVVDVDRRAGRTNPVSIRVAAAFKLPVRGIGTVFAIKREALRDWLPGSVPISGVVAALDRRGWLIRGADGKSTRQIVIPGFGRGRFYCLKLAAAHGGGDADISDSDFGEPGVDRDIDPATDIDSVEPARAIGSRPNRLAVYSPGRRPAISSPPPRLPDWRVGRRRPGSFVK